MDSPYVLVKRLLPNTFKRDLKRIVRSLTETVRYRRCVPLGAKHGKISHVVFVCKGNICRSAFAEHYAKKLCVDDQLQISSCGIEVDQGHCSPSEAVKAAEQFGVDLSHHRSQGLDACDVPGADLILAMEYPQYATLKAMFPEKQNEIFLLRDYLPGPRGFFCNLYDPFGQEFSDFVRCFGTIRQAIDNLFDPSVPRD